MWEECAAVQPARGTKRTEARLSFLGANMHRNIILSSRWTFVLLKNWREAFTTSTLFMIIAGSVQRGGWYKKPESVLFVLLQKKKMNAFICSYLYICVCLILSRFGQMWVQIRRILPPQSAEGSWACKYNAVKGSVRCTKCYSLLKHKPVSPKRGGIPAIFISHKWLHHRSPPALFSCGTVWKSSSIVGSPPRTVWRDPL